MKNVCIDVLGCRALGDTLAVTPTLRKLYNSYGKKISGKASSMKSKCAKCKIGSKCKCKKK